MTGILLAETFLENTMIALSRIIATRIRSIFTFGHGCGADQYFDYYFYYDCDFDYDDTNYNTYHD